MVAARWPGLCRQQQQDWRGRCCLAGFELLLFLLSGKLWSSLLVCVSLNTESSGVPHKPALSLDADETLPSCCFFTFFNTHQSLNCVAFSSDAAVVAGGA
jgi:hypothetical protein